LLSELSFAAAATLTKNPQGFMLHDITGAAHIMATPFNSDKKQQSADIEIFPLDQAPSDMSMSDATKVRPVSVSPMMAASMFNSNWKMGWLALKSPLVQQLCQVSSSTRHFTSDQLQRLIALAENLVDMMEVLRLANVVNGEKLRTNGGPIVSHMAQVLFWVTTFFRLSLEISKAGHDTDSDHHGTMVYHRMASVLDPNTLLRRWSDNYAHTSSSPVNTDSAYLRHAMTIAQNCCARCGVSTGSCGNFCILPKCLTKYQTKSTVMDEASWGASAGNKKKPDGAYKLYVA